MLPVENDTRQIKESDFKKIVDESKLKGIKYFIVIINLSTTMFGSVDKIDPIASYLEQKEYPYKIHLDAAFGGFIYPFTNPKSEHNFSNPRVSSVSIDGHKMLQTPYGTGLFLIRKGFMQYVTTDEAQYVPGLDFTICGSRSGANAIVIWMLLMTYGAIGWRNKMNELIRRTDILCERLDEMSISYFRNPHINIVTIRANQIPESIAKKYELVADTYEHKPSWWKIVVMDHVKMELLNQFIGELEAELV
jgi:glutamate/tyrosine decarboxylase-like PLP-dependent enzyme